MSDNDMTQGKFNTVYDELRRLKHQFPDVFQRLEYNFMAKKYIEEKMSHQEMTDTYGFSHGKLKKAILSFGEKYWRGQKAGCRAASYKKIRAWRDKNSGYRRRTA